MRKFSCFLRMALPLVSKYMDNLLIFKALDFIFFEILQPLLSVAAKAALSRAAFFMRARDRRILT